MEKLTVSINRCPQPPNELQIIYIHICIYRCITRGIRSINSKHIRALESDSPCSIHDQATLSIDHRTILFGNDVSELSLKVTNQCRSYTFDITIRGSNEGQKKKKKKKRKRKTDNKLISDGLINQTSVCGRYTYFYSRIERDIYIYERSATKKKKTEICVYILCTQRNLINQCIGPGMKLVLKLYTPRARVRRAVLIFHI